MKKPVVAFVDEEFARSYKIRKTNRALQGPRASLISGVLGDKLPGAIYLSQTLKKGRGRSFLTTP